MIIFSINQDYLESLAIKFLCEFESSETTACDDYTREIALR